MDDQRWQRRADTVPPMVGQVLGHYRIGDRLGAGGMGVVYRARDTRLERDVALKVLPAATLADDAARGRFRKEALALARLNHPNIGTVFDFNTENGVDFLVMELVAGESLQDQIARRPLPEKDVVALGIQIASALEEAHEQRIIHRDLKPGNILVTPKGQAKVLDFGLARLLRPEAEAEVTATVSELQAVAGTLPYMAPEQLRAQPADARTDIWALGVVLYEMASGARPFQGQTGFELSSAILNAPPTLLSLVGPPLRAVIDRCLEKDPDRRYQRAGEVHAALETIRAGAASAHVAVRSRMAPPPWAWATLLVMGLAAGFAGWWISRPAEPMDPLRANALTTLPGQELYPSLSPDGKYVAFTWTGPRQDNTDIYVQQIGAGAPLRLTDDPRSDYNPVWSADGRWIAFLRGNPATPLGRSRRELRLIAPLGGPERTLGEVSVQEITDNPVYLTWCADSRCLIVTDMVGEGRPDALFVVSIETGDKRQLTNPQPPAIADTNPSLSPDGESLLFLRRTTWARGELHVLPVHTDMTAAGEARHIAVSGPLPETAAWISKGDEILFATNPLNGGSAALWRVSANGAGQPARVPFVGEDGLMPAVSRSPQVDMVRLVYVRSFTDENIWRIDVSGPSIAASTPPTVAIASTKADVHPQLSPDGRRVAFASTRSGAWEIWISDPDGSNPVQITSLRAPTGTGAPHWSPDGRTIVFASDTEGQFDIFVVPSTGGKPRNITSHPTLDHVPIFSHDGQWIYFSSARSGQYQVWKVPASGGEAVQVTKDGGWLSQESVDGTSLYFTPTVAIGALTQLWRMPTSGGPAVKVVDGVMNAPFAVLQRGIYYINQRSAEPQFQFFDFASQQSVTVARGLGTYADGFAASSDGRILLYARRDSAVDDLMLVENFR
jgi:Tol biopolymer transport system component